MQQNPNPIIKPLSKHLVRISALFFALSTVSHHAAARALYLPQQGQSVGLRFAPGDHRISESFEGALIDWREAENPKYYSLYGGPGTP